MAVRQKFTPFLACYQNGKGLQKGVNFMEQSQYLSLPKHVYHDH